MYTAEDFFKDKKEGEKVHPLQTYASLSKRWGVSRQVVQKWAERDENFPSTVSGLVEGGRHANNIYPLHEIERYEKIKKISKTEEN